MRAFNFYHPTRPIYTHARFLPPSKLIGCDLSKALVAEGCYVEDAQIADSVLGIRTTIGSGCRIERSVLLGSDYYESASDAAIPGEIPIGIGRNVVLDRVIVDKNARIGDGARLSTRPASSTPMAMAITSGTGS